MENSKLINLLATFSTEELQAFDLFIRSPYFNTRKELMPLFQYLKDQAPAFPEKAIRKEQVFRAAFPGQSYDEKQLAYRMNYLLKLGERFLGIQSFEQSPVQPQLHLLETLVQRKLEKEYQFVHKKLNQQLEEREIVESEGFFHQFRIGEIGDQYFMNKDERRYDPHLEVASDNLDRFYFSKKLRMLTEMINRQHIFNQTYSQTFRDLLLKGLQESDLLDNLLLKAYYHILLMLSDESQAAAQYEEVKALFQSNVTSFSEEDKQNILSHLLNFCIQQIREQTDRRPFLEEAISLYMFGIESKIYLPKDQLSPWHYKNIIKLAFNLGNFDWAEEFMYQYSPKLQEASRENALYYNLADLYYQKKEHEKAMKFLNQVEFTDIHYNLNAKLLLLKIYYEIDEEEALLSLLASFTIYLKRNKYLSNELRKTYENFCKLLTRIMRRNPQKWPALRKDILSVSPLTDRKWLLNVLEEMQ
ncbi:MAG: hypothetical protein IPL49_03360 [Saprospirales bacterium]|nr:hypothetical protein [Saprospirales bacterium]